MFLPAFRVFLRVFVLRRSVCMVRVLWQSQDYGDDITAFNVEIVFKGRLGADVEYNPGG